MTLEQLKMIEDINFGGLLQISCHTIPADLAKWLLTKCFDLEAMELVLPSICTWPAKQWGEVAYNLQAEAIKFISTKYNIHQGMTPRIEEIKGEE
jgi:hypothetical protein